MGNRIRVRRRAGCGRNGGPFEFDAVPQGPIHVGNVFMEALHKTKRSQHVLYICMHEKCDCRLRRMITASSGGVYFMLLGPHQLVWLHACISGFAIDLNQECRAHPKFEEYRAYTKSLGLEVPRFE